MLFCSGQLNSHSHYSFKSFIIKKTFLFSIAIFSNNGHKKTAGFTKKHQRFLFISVNVDSGYFISTVPPQNFCYTHGLHRFHLPLPHVLQVVILRKIPHFFPTLLSSSSSSSLHHPVSPSLRLRLVAPLAVHPALPLLPQSGYSDVTHTNKI